MLDDFGETLTQLARGQRFQNVNVVDDKYRLVNGADQVFAGARVDTGFAANGTIHHRQKRGWNLHVRNTALKNGRHKSGKIADHAAAESDDNGLSIQALLQ